MQQARDSPSQQLVRIFPDQPCVFGVVTSVKLTISLGDSGQEPSNYLLSQSSSANNQVMLEVSGFRPPFTLERFGCVAAEVGLVVSFLGTLVRAFLYTFIQYTGIIGLSPIGCSSINLSEDSNVTPHRFCTED